MGVIWKYESDSLTNRLEKPSKSYRAIFDVMYYF